MLRNNGADYFLSLPAALSSFFSSSFTFWFAAGTSADDTPTTASSSAATARGMMVGARDASGEGDAYKLDLTQLARRVQKWVDAPRASARPAFTSVGIVQPCSQIISGLPADPVDG